MELAAGQSRPRDERVGLGDLTLRVLRWDPPDGAPVDAAATTAAPFLLVHGLASNARVWDGVARRLAAAGHLAVAVDLRGHGLSDKPDSGYDFATIAADLRALAATLGLNKPVLVGQSWGADVVAETAVRHPEISRGIVLVDGHLTDLRAGFATWEECWERLTPPPSLGLPVEKIQRWFARQHPDWPAEGLEGSLANFEVRADGTVAPWLTLDRHKLILQAMWDQRPAETWPRLGVPALIVPVDTGDPGWVTGKRAGATAAAAALGARNVPLQVTWFKGDHDIQVQHPADLAALLLEACRSGVFAGSTAS
jgi:pimeloyl-ACP methyl ester carboxylesterase